MCTLFSLSRGTVQCPEALGPAPAREVTPTPPQARTSKRTPPLPPLPPVLTGHASSLPPVLTGHVSSLLPYSQDAHASAGTDVEENPSAIVEEFCPRTERCRPAPRPPPPAASAAAAAHPPARERRQRPRCARWESRGRKSLEARCLQLRQHEAVHEAHGEHGALSEHVGRIRWTFAQALPEPRQYLAAASWAPP